MYCGHCGKEITDNAKFCQHCGKAVLVSTDSINAEVQISPKTDAHPPQKEINKKLTPRSLLLLGCGILAAIIMAVLLFGGNGGVSGKVKSLLENDLGTTVSINALYYNKEKQACLVEFETRTTVDVAAVYLDSGKVLYESDSDYYQRKFNNATTSAERGKWSSKVLEYAELVEWQFGILVSGLPEKDGWERIK
jgi:hypothetical protein